MKRVLISALLFTATSAALADNVIVTETKTWKSVPIVVDDKANTYTVQGTIPEGDYYYTYSGYRCLAEKKDIAGVNVLMFHASVAGGTDIYCYPDV